jgi:diguanylate cyclase (GGDEF)-like protein
MLKNVLLVHRRQASIRKEVQNALLQSLYQSRLSLLVGAAVGTTVAGFIAWQTQNLWLTACAVLILCAGMVRVISFGMFSHDVQHAYERVRSVIFDAGAWAFAALLGMFTFLTLLLSDDPVLHLLSAAVSTGFAAAAAGRNTGRPMIAIGQLIFCGLPLSIGLVMVPSPAHIMLAVSNLLFLAVFIDVTLKTYETVLGAFGERQEKLDLAAVYEKLSRTDPLTGIANRMTLKQNLEEMLSTSPSPIALIWIDLDHFKEINDTLGHAAGDLVLNDVAQSLTGLAGDEGAVARFGGDEFILIQPVANPQAAFVTGDRIRMAMNRPINAEGTLVDISTSIGIAVSEAGAASADDLLRHADMALYDAKSKGRNCVSMFHPRMEEQLLRTKRIESELRHALERKELTLHFQPIIHIASGRATGCEALLRWHHPELGDIEPATFIPIAEGSGQIEGITDWVLDRACAAATLWPDDVSVSVNISPTLLRGRALQSLVHEVLVRHGLPPRRLELEITESVLVEDNPNVAPMLRGLQDMGIRLSLDDFGTGYSSLSYLCKYRFDALKIDKAFTADVGHSSEARAIVQAVASLASSLSITVVAEGVETAGQLRFIHERGCTSAQGHYFSRPVDARRISEFLTHQAVKPMHRTAFALEDDYQHQLPGLRRA